MLLTALAENIRDRINSNKELWTPDDLSRKAEACIDFVTPVSQPGFKLLVVPEMNTYLADETNSRQKVVTLDVTKFITIIVGYTFESQTYQDTVATWEEASFILDVREKIELFLLTQCYQDINLLITDVDPQQINEQELDRRNFNAITSFGFNDQPCGLTQESLSMLPLSNTNTESAERRASMRRAVLSERKQGRR